MSPLQPYSRPLYITAVDDEMVFLGEGPVCFSMTISAARQTFLALAAALLALQPSGSDARRRPVILVVEDDPVVREIAAALLEDAGYVVILAEGPGAALQALETSERINLLFTDIQMPGDLDGVALAQLVKDRWPEIPVLFTSRQAVLGDRVPHGGRFIPKPYAAAEVLKHVDELIAA